MSVLQPTIRVTMNLAKVPASEGTTVYRWAHKPLADLAEFSEGRILKIGDIERALSTFSGDWDVATVQLELDDPDGLFRGIASGVTTRYTTNRELLFEILSETGRAALLDWRSLFRGRITSLQCPPGHKASIKCSDELGSRFSGFDLEKKMGVPITRNEHPNMPEGNINRIYPIVIGEHSDQGAVDANGNSAEKGLLPVIDVGTVIITEDGDFIAPWDMPIAMLAVPEPTAVVNGTAGVTSYAYGVTALSPYGETTAGTVTVTDGPAVLTSTDSITLSWTAVPGAIAYRVYGRDSETPTNRLILLNNEGAYVNPETTWEDEGDVFEDTVGCGPPATNNANVDQPVPTAGQPIAYPWGRLITKIGANSEVFQVYASDLAASPRRARLPDSAYGTECLVYGRPGWPHAEPYVEVNGIRMGCIYMRGPRYEHHKAGTVTITWNGCGDEDEGDGTGATIDEAFPVLQHVLNEYVLKNAGLGYRTGAYGPLEEYADGVSKLKTTAFAACQALTVDWIGDRGYLAAFAIVEPISLRTFLQRFFVTFACLGGADHFGRIYPALIDDTADPLVGRSYRHRIEVEAIVSQEFDDAAVETRVVLDYDYDTEARTFRVKDQVIEDQLATAAYTPGAAIGSGVPIEKGKRECMYTRDRATAMDAGARHLMRVKAPPRYVAWRTDLTGLEDENGAQVRFTHPDGAGSSTGDDATPFLVVKHRVLANSPKRVVMTGFDLDRILSTNFGDLQNESTMSANLYSEVIFAPPTAGAYELR